MNEITLMTAAASVGFFHTIIGVDHFVPFITLGKAQDWSLKKTLVITSLCGVGHVLGSLILAFAGIGLGSTVESIIGIESGRGDIASWILIIFGFSYAAWGMWRALRGKNHSHVHVHNDGTVHDHDHHHNENEHVHVHTARNASLVSIMSMFIIFVFGPCEFMIAPVMAAYKSGWHAVALVSLAFSVATIGAMVGAVTLGYLGVSVLRTQFLERFWESQVGFVERHMHTITGLLIAGSGLILPYLES